jgi:hypothetical protein
VREDQILPRTLPEVFSMNCCQSESKGLRKHKRPWERRTLTVDQKEAWLMRGVGERVCDALREVGIAPR